MKKSLQIAFYLLGICLAVWVGYTLSGNLENNKKEEVVACTQDTKECADGTFVSRVGKDCEFEICQSGDKPTATSSEAASPLKTFYDAEKKVGFEYLDNFYIENILNKYVLPVQWPPEITVSTSTYSCKKGGSSVLLTGKTETKYIDGKTYCLTTQVEGAAGSVYTTYIYKSIIDKKVVSLTFIVRVPQCANYDEVEKLECEEEKKIFNIDIMVNKLFSTIKFQ